MKVVADTGPLNYLALIGCTDIPPRLFTGVAIPPSVRRELEHPETPVEVRDWLASAPAWLTTCPVLSADASGLAHLDDGERDVILLAETLKADLVLMDERAGNAVVRARGFAATGTLVLLDRGARRGWIDLPEAVHRLRQTSVRCRPTLLQALLAQHEA